MTDYKKTINLRANDGEMIAFSGDNRKILAFVVAYAGDDLVSDLKTQDFVTKSESMGVTLTFG